LTAHLDGGDGTAELAGHFIIGQLSQQSLIWASFDSRLGAKNQSPKFSSIFQFSNHLAFSPT
jgi:hypothetical protein